VPSFTLKTETGVPVNIAVLPENARFSGSRKIGRQADMAAVKRLLDENVNNE
jgi:hypothetical protein